ncbi:MAG: DNA-binding response regulator [Gammaproteobacteria bacterium]|nr:MAG: DNA-binding response regulator [Gammaproteobacteria bacterium]
MPESACEMDTHIIVADDHPLFRDAVTHLLERSIPMVRVSQVESFRQLNEQLAGDVLPSLVLLDLKLIDTRGLDGLLLLKKHYPSLPVLIISAFDDDKVVQMAMQCGASGFVPKRLEMERMAEAIQSVLEGEMWFPELEVADEAPPLDTKALVESLTPAQLRVLSLLRDGMPSKEMAAAMSVTEATIKAHLTEIFRKLKVKNRTQAVLATQDLDLPSQGLPE